MSLPLPTMLGRGPLAGGFGYFDGTLQGTSFHSFSGYDALKHPFFGSETLLIASCHSFRSRNSSAESDTAVAWDMGAVACWATAYGDAAMKAITAADNIRTSADTTRAFERIRLRLNQRG